MKLECFSCAGLICLYLMANLFFATGARADGALDTSFGYNVGPVLCSTNAWDSGATALIARYDDGRILVGGSDYSGLDLYVTRWNADGSPDTTFGSNGTINASNGFKDLPYAMAIQTLSENDQRILLAGQSIRSDESYFIGSLMRLNSDGSLDDGGPDDTTPSDSFGTNGTGVVEFDRQPEVDDPTNEAIFDIAVAEDGVIGVCGKSEIDIDIPGGGRRTEALAALLSSNGIPVATFADDGVKYLSTTNEISAYEYFSAMSFDSAGNLVLGGGRYDEARPFRVVKMDRSGNLLAEFDGDSGTGDGIVDIACATGTVADIVMDGDDILVFGAIGEDESGPGTEFGFCSLDSGNGQLNTNFNNTGMATVAVPDHSVRGASLALDSSNRLWGAGRAEKGNRLYPALACVGRDGSIENTFGYGGYVVFNDRLADHGPYVGTKGVTLAAEPDGRMAAAAPFFESDDGLFRIGHDGFLDGSMVEITPVSEGVVTELISRGPDKVVGVERLADGRFMVAGNVNSDSSDESDGLFLACYEADGLPAFDFPLHPKWDSFDMMGKQKLSLSEIFSTGARYEQLKGMAIDSQGRSLLYGQFRTAASADFNFSSVCRLTPDGELDTTFGAGDGDGCDGLALVDASIFITETAQHFIDIAVLPDDGCIALGNGFMNGDGQDDVVLAKFDSDGHLDPSFGTNGNGIVWFAWAEGMYTRAAALQPDREGRLLVASNLGGELVILRFLADGSLDPTFGADDGDGWDGAVKVELEFYLDPESIMLQRCGGEERIIVTGTRGGRCFAMRFRSDGTLDTTFGNGDGILFYNSTAENVRASLLQEDGKPVVLGSDSSGGDIAISRGTWDGRIDRSFGGDRTGTVVTGTDKDDVVADGVLVNDAQRIVAAGSAGYNMALWRFEKTPVSTVRAGFGKALHFDGIDDYAVVEGTNSIWFTGTDTYTITLWARPETNGWLYRLDGVVGAYRDYISLDADGRVTFAVAKGGSRADTATSPDPIPWGRWSHIAGVRDATNITLYINGHACATQALKEVTLDAPLSEANLYFGVKPVSPMEQHFGGALDEICLFREVLPGPAISAWAFRRPDRSHPAYSNLVVQFDCDVVSNDTTPNAVDEEMTANLHNMPAEAPVASLLPTDYSVVNTTSSGQLVGHDLLGSSDTGLDWNMTFQVVSNGTLGTVSVVDSNRFLFSPFSNATGTNRFAYRCVNVDGTTSEVTTAQIVIPADFDGDGIDDIWEQEHGLSPTHPLDADENWDGDPYNNRQEFIADTHPTNPASFFRIDAISNTPSVTVYFQSSSNRVYTLKGRSNLIEGTWTNIPSGGPRMGAGGADSMLDTNEPPQGSFYRMQVELP